MTNKVNNRKNIFKNNFFILKWITFIAGFLIFSGVTSLALILLCYKIITGKNGIELIWIVGMVPMMALFAIPLSIIIYRQIKNNLSLLINSMDKVASGNLDTYIPMANAKDFKDVFNNFNKMVAEIQSIETLRANMFDNLSHELKTPIASINGFSHLLVGQDVPQEKKDKYLKIIIDESERLENLVKNVLLLSKLDSIEIVTHKEDYNLTQQLQDCIISLENDWANKEINISANLENCFYFGEKQLMKSLWTNLLSNAIKYTPKNGDITIDLKSEQGNIIISICDTGIGISEEALEHIFDKHYQIDKRISGNGQGLGLPIVKRIVKLCNGTINVTSNLNEGSTFTVVLPR